MLPGAAASIMPSAPLMGALPGFQSCLPQPPQLPLFPNMYNTTSTTFQTLKDKPDGLVRNPSNLSNLSCATAQPQLSSECLSSTNSDDSLLGGITSSPCYQSSYSSGYINPFQAPNSPSRASPPALDNSALLEQTAAMMKAATAALQSLQSPASLYHSPQRQQPTQNFQSATSPLSQHCYAPQVPSVFPVMPAVPSRGFVPVQTAPSVASIGMQALEELMMGDSSQDSSPPPASHTLQSVQSAPASFYASNLNAQPWGSTALPCPQQAAPAKFKSQQEASAHCSMGQVFDNLTQSADRSAPRAATPAKPKALKRSVSDIPVFDCKAAAAAMAAREAAKAVQEAAAAPAVVAFDQEADLADLDLPLIDDCFLTDMASSGVDSDLAAGMCFDGLTDFQSGLDRSDSSSNLLAEQLLQFADEPAAPVAAPKRKGRQSKKLKARGGVAKASAQVLATTLL